MQTNNTIGAFFVDSSTNFSKIGELETWLGINLAKKNHRNIPADSTSNGQRYKLSSIRVCISKFLFPYVLINEFF